MIMNERIYKIKMSFKIKSYGNNKLGNFKKHWIIPVLYFE